MGEPVLEKYVFVPNEGIFSLEEAVRISVQLILENTNKVKVKFSEIEQDSIQALTPLILKVLSHQPVIQSEALIVQSDRKAKINDCLFVVGSNLLQNKNLLKDFAATDNFVLSREAINCRLDDKLMEILSVYTTPVETLVLLRKRLAWKLPTTFHLKSPQWIKKLQKLKQSGSEILVFSQGNPTSGILGFSNCIRKEPEGEATKCFFMQDDAAPIVDLNLEFYQKQLRKGLAINVFKNGHWGTYRHLLLEPELVSKEQHTSVKLLSKNNFSNVKWIDRPLTTEEGCVRVCYAGLNFTDVMIASGCIQYTISSELRKWDSLLGLEFSGRDAK